MRILMVATTYLTLRAFLLPLAAHFHAKGWKVDAMARGVTGCPDCASHFDQTWETAWERNPLALNNLLREPRNIRSIIARNKYDIVHVHTPVASFVTRFALRNAAVPRPVVIYTAHGFHFYEGGPRLSNLVYRGLEKLAGRWTDHLVVINNEDREAALRYGVVPPGRVHFMPGIGVDTESYAPERFTELEIEGLKRELGIGRQSRLLLMVAEFIPRKRHLDLIQAFSRMKTPDVHLLLAGNGPLLDAVKKAASAGPARDRVHFLGFRNDIQLLMRASEATILPSRQEGLPRCIMESLAMKTPVIAANIRGVTDIVAGGDCGMLYNAGDIGGLASALDALLSDSASAKRMGENGRKLMERTYDIRHILTLHEKLYEEALSSGPRPA